MYALDTTLDVASLSLSRIISKSRFQSTSSMANNAPIWCSTEHFQPQTCYIWYHMISTNTIGTSKCTISYYLCRSAIETHRVATTAPFGCLPTVKSSEALMRLENWNPFQKSNFEDLLAMSHCPGSDWNLFQKPRIQPWQGLDPIHWSIRGRPREHLDEFLDAVVPRPNLPCTCDRGIDISWLHIYRSTMTRLRKWHNSLLGIPVYRHAAAASSWFTIMGRTHQRPIVSSLEADNLCEMLVLCPQHTILFSQD